MNTGPIVIVEDDGEDCEMLTGALTAVGIKNEFRCFDTPALALRYFKETTEKPFLIISDINMPFMNGIEFRRIIKNEGLPEIKRIPFVFLTTSADPKLVEKAQDLFIQGYFIKPNSIHQLKALAKSIIDYWSNSQTFSTINAEV